jgi:hypothetical protein
MMQIMKHTIKHKQQRLLKLEKLIFLLFKIELVVLGLSALLVILSFGTLAAVLGFMALYLAVPAVLLIVLISLLAIPSLDAVSPRFRFIAIINWVVLVALIINVTD